MPRPFARPLLANNIDPVALYGRDLKAKLGGPSLGVQQLDEDELGLRLQVEIPDTSAGRDVKGLDLDGASFGFTAREDGQARERRNACTFADLGVQEVSIVRNPPTETRPWHLRSMQNILGVKRICAYQV